MYFSAICAKYSFALLSRQPQLLTQCDRHEIIAADDRLRHWYTPRSDVSGKRPWHIQPEITVAVLRGIQPRLLHRVPPSGKALLRFTVALLSCQAEYTPEPVHPDQMLRDLLNTDRLRHFNTRKIGVAVIGADTGAPHAAQVIQDAVGNVGLWYFPAATIRPSSPIRDASR